MRKRSKEQGFLKMQLKRSYMLARVAKRKELQVIGASMEVGTDRIGMNWMLFSYYS